MRKFRLTVLLILALAGVPGCTQTIPVGAGKSLLTISRDDERKFLEKLGYSHNNSALVSRSRTGDRLFIQFENRNKAPVGHKVAIVSSNEIVVKNLPGESQLNDDGEPVCWTTRPEKSKAHLEFANGHVLPEGVFCIWSSLRKSSDGEFIPLFRKHEDHWWIGRIESPQEEIVTFDWQKEFELLISQGDRLHVFVRGKPEGKPRSDGWFILKHYDYKVEGNKALLLGVQDFYYTWSVMDFDPESNLMFASSWDTMFAHGLLVNIATGNRKNVRGRSGSGYFLNTNVVERFREAIQANR
jgi:hypothetical protein